MAGGEIHTAELEFYRSNIDKRGWDVNMVFDRGRDEVAKASTPAERMAWAAWSAIGIFTARNLVIDSKYQPLAIDRVMLPPVDGATVADPKAVDDTPVIHETDKPRSKLRFSDDGADGVTVKAISVDNDPRWQRIAEKFGELFDSLRIKEVPDWVLPKLEAMEVCTNCGAKHDQFVYDSDRIEEHGRNLKLTGVRLEVVRCKCLSCGNVAVAAREIAVENADP
jgi:dipeptidyl aminopeptidase/acylaminoacyl peptidase